MKSKLIAYSMDFSSFLLQKTKFQEKIRNIILFGSVSRGDEEKDSDIDIFVDVINERKELEEDIKKCLENFFNSGKYLSYWKLLDIKNEIILTIGDLHKWKHIHPSIVSNGITLYGKFKLEIKGGNHKTLFVWENIKPNSKRVLFNKQLFGYIANKKFYRGLLQEYQGERLGKGCIIIPLEHAHLFQKFFRERNITVKIKKLVEYS